MALFNTPSLLGHIFQKETFPQGDSGIAGLMAGLAGGMQTKGQHKQNVSEWEKEKEAAIKEGRAVPPKPGAFGAFFGASPQYGKFAGKDQKGAFGSANQSFMPQFGMQPGMMQPQAQGAAQTDSAAPYVPPSSGMLIKSGDLHRIIDMIISSAPGL